MGKADEEHNFKLCYPEASMEWDYDKNNIRPEDLAPRSRKFVWWKCKNNHSWYARIYDREKRKASCPVCIKSRSYSKIAILWLEEIMKRENIHIKHAGNGGEYQIPGLNVKIDGYCEETNTIYEFYGDYWHGNPRKFDSECMNLRCKKTFGELYCNTLDRADKIRNLGYNLIEIWEDEYLK